MIQLVSPTHFSDYELIDTGNFEKLERFGNYVIARPEPQAIWDKALSEKEWQKSAQAYFKRGRQNANYDETPERGEWILKKGMPEQWFVNYNYKSMQLKMRLGLTAFKHVGVFPEQAENWNYIFDTLQSYKGNETNVLNLFAYTGTASLAAKAAGADVTHVDSVKQVISWSRENMEASRLNNIKWVVEDALKFVQREVRRGNKYNGIILDPPAYGRGPDGEKWILENSLNELIKLCGKLLKEKNIFFVLNMYSMGFSVLVAENILSSVFGSKINIESGELFCSDREGRNLPLGIFSRFNDNY
jgi:23S rRNA (cytosine1962-C5)-methyltransferase